MSTHHRRIGIIALILLVVSVALCWPAEPAPGVETGTDQRAVLHEDAGQTTILQAERVKDKLQDQASSVFRPSPLGWDVCTLTFLYR